jgi:MerR family copper efflux transcriptional regulator
MMKRRESENLERCDAGAAAELPVACTLGPDDGAARMDRWQRLADTATPSARRAEHQLEVRYQPGPGVREELQALAAAEAKCCSFVAWAVTQDGDHPVLHVTADPQTPDDVAPIAALFGVT